GQNCGRNGPHVEKRNAVGYQQKARQRKKQERGTRMKPPLDNKKNGSRGVQSIDTGGIILGVLSRARGPLKLRDLAEEAGMAPAQLHPYLVSFRKMDLVEQNEAGQ